MWSFQLQRRSKSTACSDLLNTYRLISAAISELLHPVGFYCTAFAALLYLYRFYTSAFAVLLYPYRFYSSDFAVLLYLNGLESTVNAEQYNLLYNLSDVNARISLILCRMNELRAWTINSNCSYSKQDLEMLNILWYWSKWRFVSHLFIFGSSS